MPDYKAPGVYVEEVAPGLVIESPKRTVAGFVGPGAPPGALADSGTILKSFTDFTDRFGSTPEVAGARYYFWRAVAGYFREGGAALVVEWAADPGADAYRAALVRLEAIPEISIVAAPGALLADDDEAAAITQALIDHADDDDRFAIVETPPGLDIAAVRQWRARFTSDHAGLYYPWLQIAAADGTPSPQPPAGHVAGIFARTDRERAVWKAPANEAVRSAIGLAVAISKEEQDLLNPASINCIRAFPGKGILVFGARTLATDPDYTYVSTRRFLSMIAHAIGDALAAAAFEPNRPALWAHVRGAVENYLTLLWRAGALQGVKPEQAFFVRCDRTTMTQTDIDQGRLVCEIGVAPVRPAEFLILRLAQVTGESAG